MTSTRFTVFLLTSIILLGITGCGPGGPPVQFVTGTVSVDGVLLEDCIVTFCPKGAYGDASNLNRPLLAIGSTDAKGQYRLSAVQGGAFDKGTTVGEYAVSLVKRVNLNMPGAPADPRVPRNVGFAPVWHYDTPRLFEEPEDTPITVTVKKGKNKFDFDLKSDGSSYTLNGESFTVGR